ncbi:MAG: hypothetical protein APF83_11270 [Lutibacter sp. BRH_c52]|nr:MAG: hypothetical protein APF83_11270 [Lutibacter sp. BRH_c52]
MTESYVLPSIIIFIISIALWLILRQVFLWYWKINKIVELLEKNNALLESVLVKNNNVNQTDLNSKIEKNPTTESNEKSNIKTEKKIEKIEKPFSEEVQKLIEKLKNDELIIKIKDTNEIKIIKKEQYDLDKELHLSHKYIVIYEN